MAGESMTTTTAVPGAATYSAGPTYTTGTTYTTAADVAGRQSYGGSTDGLSLLAQRLQALTDDGVKSEHTRAARARRPRGWGAAAVRAGGRRLGACSAASPGRR